MIIIIGGGASVGSGDIVSPRLEVLHEAGNERGWPATIAARRKEGSENGCGGADDKRAR